MPQVVNGIGTWYYGKRNQTVRRGVCNSCGAVSELRSYDTTLFFVVFFVPLIPIKRVHVLDACPSCRKHRYMPHKQWEALHNEGIAKALEAVQSRPGDSEAALSAIATTVELRDERSFLGLSALLEDQSGKDPKALSGLAEGYEFFGHHEAAEDAMRRSLQIEPDAQRSERLGIHLLRYGSVDDAMPLLEDVLAGRDPARAGVGFLAVEAYQAAGRHTEALALLSRMETAFPAAAVGKEFAKYRKTSTKLERSGKPAKSSLIHAKDPKRAGERDWTARLPWLVGPVLGTVALIWWLSASWWIGGHRQVHVVNGLTKGYTAEIGGVRTTVPPGGRSTIRIAEGAVRVRIISPVTHVVEQTVQIDSNFFTRAFTSPVYVINPDLVCPIDWEQGEYSTTSVHGVRGPEDRHRLYIGQPMYRFDDIDYVFQPLPQSLYVKGSSIVKRSVELMVHLPTQDRLNIVHSELGEGGALAVAKAGVLADPDDEGYLGAVAALSKPAEGAAALAPLLNDIPLHLGAHRIYQTLAEQANPTADLAADYASRLAKTPDDGGLKYLLGRVTHDHVESRRLFAQASRDPHAARYALGALAFDAVTAGEFEKALQFIALAPKGEENEQRLASTRFDAWHALGRFKEILADPSMMRNVDQYDGPELAERMYYVFRASGRAKAIELLNAYMVGVRNNPEHAAEAAEAEQAFKALVSYYEGDSRPLAKCASGPNPGFYQLLEAGDFSKIEHPTEPTSWGAARDFAVIVAAEGAGKDAIAREWTKSAVVALRTGTFEDRQLADWLEGKSEPKPGDPALILGTLELKRAALILLAQRYPKLRDECLELASRLNFDHRPPYLLFTRAISKASTDDAATKAH